MTYLLATPTEESIAQPPSKKHLAVDDSYRREPHWLVQRVGRSVLGGLSLSDKEGRKTKRQRW